MSESDSPTDSLAQALMKIRDAGRATKDLKRSQVQVVTVLETRSVRCGHKLRYDETGVVIEGEMFCVSCAFDKVRI